MIFTFLATLCTGVFAGAAIYITLVEHPARLACGTAAAVAEFGPSYRRAAPMQASLAAVGSLAAVVGWWQGYGSPLLIAGLLLGSVIPFTLLVIYPTNTRLLDPRLDSSSPEAAVLLRRWGRLHLVRSLASGAAFIVLVTHLSAGPDETLATMWSLTRRSASSCMSRVL
ncbi:MAG: DUF1772 domain-containing protein [Luteitalea sp.]|nr:DUF1772 domain-containing protein [Luteitalea sp.]